jgi:hypothetical protein
MLVVETAAMAMTAKRRGEWVEVAQQTGVVLTVAAVLLAAGLMSGRPARGEWVATAKLVAIAEVVVATSKLRGKWVAGTAMLMILPMVTWGLVALVRGEWVGTAILAAMVVLTVKLADGGGWPTSE